MPITIRSCNRNLANMNNLVSFFSRRASNLFCLLALVAVSGPVFAQHSGVKQVCENGSVDGFSCSNVDLLARMTLSELTSKRDPFGNPSVTFSLNDIWGWTHEESGREFLVVGRTDGTAFVEVTDPLNPMLLGEMASTQGKKSSWRDMKVYADHAYIVADSQSGHGMQVFDLTRLLSVTDPVEFTSDNVYTGVSSVHNIVINEDTGFAFAVGSRSGGTTCGGGLHMIDLAEPANPVFAGCFSEPGTGRSGTGYTHDAHCIAYAGPDDDWSGREICVGSNENAVVVSDVTDKSAPLTVSVGRYPATEYTHQGWMTEDHRYYFQGDELDEARGAVGQTRTLVWDLEDLDEPMMVAEFFANRTTIDHNMYVVGNRLFQSQYVDGLRVLDITDPTAPVEVGFFDTLPQTNVSVWVGSWSNYPFLSNGVVAITDRYNGLFLVQPQASSSTAVEGAELPNSVASLDIFPNPFRDRGTIELVLDRSEHVRIDVFDVLGRRVAQLYDGLVTATTPVAIPMDSLPEAVNGSIFIRITGDSFDMTRQVLRAR